MVLQFQVNEAKGGSAGLVEYVGMRDCSKSCDYVGRMELTRQEMEWRDVEEKPEEDCGGVLI